jgi:hypothetical protein
VRALVGGKRGDELGQAVLLPGYLALRARVEVADHLPLGLRGLVRHGDRLLERLEELLRGPGRVGQAEPGQHEVGVLRERLLEERPRVGRAELLEQAAALDVELAGLLRSSRDRDLVGGGGGERGADDARAAQRDAPHDVRVLHTCLPCSGESVPREMGAIYAKLGNGREVRRAVFSAMRRPVRSGVAGLLADDGKALQPACAAASQ